MFQSLLHAAALCSWLTFNAGVPEGSPPAAVFNGRWDDLLTFDVELRGLLAETVTVDSQAYLRFSTSPGTVPSDSVGWPELPVVRRLVWLPDDSDIELEYSASCCEGIECLPVYPAPLDSLVTDSTCTPFIGEFFRRDSAAYVSEEWYPDTLAKLVGEFRLRDLRVGIVDVYPVQFLAAGESLRVWSDIEVALEYDTSAVWPTCGLGSFDGLVGEQLLGYTPASSPWAPVPGSVERPGDLVEGPENTPDYVILVAAGLDGWWVDSLARHREVLNGFDVAIVRTDSVLSQFGDGATAITPWIIRDFTEAMWDWGSPETKRSSYLLLIGDHEDPAFAEEDWFLPTRTIPDPGGTEWAERGSDGWYSGFGDDPDDFAVFPDMMIGRLPARSAAELQGMIDLVREFEEAVEYPPSREFDWRRRLVRLEGQGVHGYAYLPTSQWTQSVCTWAGYGCFDHICGDGDPFTSGDGSTMSSRQWCDACTDMFEGGAQVVFYVDHGAVHFFECGVDGPTGVPDSTFDNLDVDELCSGQESHGWPFVILGGCSMGTFNWTDRLQYDDGYPPWMYLGSNYDFSVDCLAESFISNLQGGAIAVYGGSWALHYGSLIHAKYFVEESLYRGITRVGDIVAGGRIEFADLLWQPTGDWDYADLASTNLLGDPAVDIGDRVKHRDLCDLVVSPEDLEITAYPTRIWGAGTVILLQVRVRNAGAVETGAFEAELHVACGSYDTTLTCVAASLTPGAEGVLGFRLVLPGSVSLPAELELVAVADPEGETPDCWTANNDAMAVIEVLDAYPNEAGWPVRLPGSVRTPPCLHDLDGDGAMEIVAACGMSVIQSVEPDGHVNWTAVTPSPVNPGGIGNACSIPVAGNVCGDEDPEVIVDCQGHLVILAGGTGEVLHSLSHDWNNLETPRTVTLLDAVREGSGELPREEMAFLDPDVLYLARVQSGSLMLLDTEPRPHSLGGVEHAWVTAIDLDAAGPVELVVSLTQDSGGLDRNSALCLYRYQNGQGSYYDVESWHDQSFYAIPAVSQLAGQGVRMALSRLASSSDHSPAYILDPGLALQDSCQPTSTPSSNILCCMMADWRPEVPGLDRIIAPAENQCMIWGADGVGVWHSIYSYPDSYRPPFGALGDLDGDEDPDLLVGTRSGAVMAIDHLVGAPLTDLGFPYTLPSEVCGGYCIADIDLDGRVEVVFGTMDNYLHVWELGECDEGYAPWPQVQHDAARTGVLE